MSGFVDANQTLNSAGTPTTHGKLEEPDHSSANWYFTRDEIENHSPSRKDGIDLKRETYFRKSYCTFLQDLGMRLKVPQVTIATAIVFSHRFFLRQSHARNDRYMVATICMFLAGKVEETPRQLKDVILVSYEIRNKKDPAACERIKWQKGVYDAQRELVLVGERLVLTTLGFDLNIHHPYKPLVAAIKKFKVAQNAALAQVAWNFVNDGLRTSLCLQFKPHHIAAGAIFLAAKFLKVKLPSDGEKVWWQEFDVTPRQLEEVSNQMLELYEQNRAGPSSRSSDPSASAGPKTEPAAYVSQPAGAALPPSSNGVHQDAPHMPQETIANDFDSETVHVEQSSLKEESLERQDHIETYNEVDNETSRLHMNNGEQLPPEGEASPDGHLPVRTNEEDGDIDECELADDANMHDEDLRPREVSAVSETQNDTSNTEPETIDKVKLKAALEKRRKFKSERLDSKPQVDFTDEEELLERELEHGVEAAAEAEKAKQEPRMSNSWSSSDNDIDNRHEDSQGGEDRNELTVDRVEEGELPTSAGPEHARSPRKSFSPEKNHSPPPKRREHGGRDQYHGRRDSSYDKYRHGHSRGDYYHSSHHSYRSDGDWERHRHKDRNWVERDAKRSRYE